MSEAETFKLRVDLTKAYCETAKAYVQISSAGLALPLFFTQAIFGKDAAEKGIRLAGLPCSIVLAWIFFLLAIAFGLLYQWLSIRLMWDQLHESQRTSKNCDKPGFRQTWWVPRFGWLNRSMLFGGMVFSLYLGALCFVCFAAHALRR